MHKFTTYNLQFLRGCELTQVVLVGRWAVSLIFTEGYRITIECPFAHVRNGKIFRTDFSHGLAGPIYLHELFDQTIVNLQITDYELTMTFSNGDAICIYGEDGMYESGQISGPDGLMVF